MTLEEALADWFNISEAIERGDPCPGCGAEWLWVKGHSGPRALNHDAACVVGELRRVEDTNGWVRKITGEEGP